MIEGDGESWAEIIGDPDGEVKGPLDSRDDRSDEGALLELGSLEGYKEGCAERIGDPDGKVEGHEMIETRVLTKAHFSN